LLDNKRNNAIKAPVLWVIYPYHTLQKGCRTIEVLSILWL